MRKFKLNLNSWANHDLPIVYLERKKFWNKIKVRILNIDIICFDRYSMIFFKTCDHKGSRFKSYFLIFACHIFVVFHLLLSSNLIVPACLFHCAVCSDNFFYSSDIQRSKFIMRTLKRGKKMCFRFFCCYCGVCIRQGVVSWKNLISKFLSPQKNFFSS